MYDKNGIPVQNAFIQIPQKQKEEIDAGAMNNRLNVNPNFFNNVNKNNIQNNVSNLNAINNTDQNKRKLFLDQIGGLLGSANESMGGALPGVAVGVGAAGAGMAARQGRKDQFYFDKTKIELDTNFNEFKKEYTDYEYSELRRININAARLNGSLNCLEKNLVYRVNNRILEMMDLT